MGAQAFFLPATSGLRFCIYHPPAAGTAACGAVLYLHPWAEEMNKSRRMAAMQARAMAAAGFAVLQIDLHGCGDSSDTWAQASWAGWVDDTVLAARWLLQRHPGTVAQPLWLWGLRAGALLAVQAAQRLAVPCHFLFWQPAPSGKLLLQQFLRLKLAAGLQADGEQGDKDGNSGKGVVEALRAGLAAGQTQDIAGYALPPALAHGLESAVLAPPAPSQSPPPADTTSATGAAAACQGSGARRLVWLEVSTRPEASLLPASQASIQAWRDAGHTVHTQVVPGPAFWQTVEIEDAPALLQASLVALCQDFCPAPAAQALEAQT